MTAQPHVRTQRTRRALLGLTALVITGITATLGVTSVSTAYADNYPSWSDVEAARSNEAAQQTQIAQITKLIAGLESQVAAAQAMAQQRWTENNAAQQAYAAGQSRAQQLQFQASEARAKAEASRKQAAQLTAQFARSAGNDLTAQLITSGDRGSDLLYQLGTMSKLSATSKNVFEQANQDANTAQALTDQAEVAKNELANLAAAAQSSLNDAVSAQQQVSAALMEQENHQIELTVQLQALTNNRSMTEQQYQAGVAAEKQRRLEEEEAARRRAAENPGNGGGNNGGGSGGGDAPSTPSTPSTPVFDPPPSRVDGQAIVQYAEQFVGVVPYGWGADPSDSFGCDGLTQYVYGKFGIWLPRLVSKQAAMGVQVSRSNAQAGDLVVWPGEHIGIYDGRGGVIHSPDWGRYVTHASGLWGSYYFVRIL